MTTTVKSRPILAEVSAISNVSHEVHGEEDMTVEEYLEHQCEAIIQEFRNHTARLLQKLRQQYDEGAQSLKLLMQNTLSPSKPICVQLKCMAGQHIGQRFRLEATGMESEDVFKIGRSTGRQFKEKGVSIYKDKEVSTTHAKIEVKNGQAFFVDLRSTNGTQLNSIDCEALVPYRLKNGDVILMGSTELKVEITDCEEDLENLTSTTL